MDVELDNNSSTPMFRPGSAALADASDSNGTGEATSGGSDGSSGGGGASTLSGAAGLDALEEMAGAPRLAAARLQQCSTAMLSDSFLEELLKQVRLCPDPDSALTLTLPCP